MRLATALALLCILAPAGTAQTPDLGPGAAEHPDADAIVLRREHHFTLDPDGAVTRRVVSRVKILARRAIRRFSDPRIAWREGEDEVTIHHARTILPDGKVLPVPEYSVNLAAPGDVAGWPAWSDWRETIVSFSGITPGCVLELDYSVRTKAGVLPWLSADLRLDDDHPQLGHVVTLMTPIGTTVNHTLSRARAEVKDERDAVRAQSWFQEATDARRGEPQSPPWRERCARLWFTTCPTMTDWATRIARVVSDAATPDDAIRAFAEKAVEGVDDTEKRIEAVVRRLRETTHEVSSRKTWRSLGCRPAGTVFQDAYGSPLEAAALTMAALRGLGLEVTAAAAIVDDDWEGVPVPDDVFAGIVLRVRWEGGSALVHPRDGVLRDPGPWGGHSVLEIRDGKLTVTSIRRPGHGRVSSLQVVGRLRIDAKGELRGDLTVHRDGVFHDPAALESARAQKAALGKLVGRLVPGLEVTEHAILEATDRTMAANVVVRAVLAEHAAGRLMEIASDPPFLASVPLPLGRSARTTPVRTAGGFRESVILVIEYPSKWKAPLVPAAVKRIEGPWGHVSQSVSATPGRIQLTRSVELAGSTIPAPQFRAIRKAIDALRTTAARLLLVGP